MPTSKPQQHASRTEGWVSSAAGVRERVQGDGNNDTVHFVPALQRGVAHQLLTRAPGQPRGQ